MNVLNVWLHVFSYRYTNIDIFAWGLHVYINMKIHIHIYFDNLGVVLYTSAYTGWPKILDQFLALPSQ